MKKLKTSRKGRRFIKRHEGLRLTPYKVGPFEKYWTIGYGHYGPDVKPGMVITQHTASRMLTSDLHKDYEPYVRRALPPGAKQCEFDALVSFAYNLGVGAVIDPDLSTLAKRLASSEGKTYPGRCRIYRDELPRWNKGGGQVLPGLTERRKDEVRLATKGRYR